MGRIKKCKECDAVLHCKECGARQTPIRKWEKILLNISPEDRAKIEKEAKDKGVSVTEIVRSAIAESMSG